MTIELVKAYVTMPFYERKDTRVNISRVIHSLTHRAGMPSMLLDAGLFSILYENLQKQTMLKRRPITVLLYMCATSAYSKILCRVCFPRPPTSI